MRYVYILRSIASPGHFYSGVIGNLKARFLKHNAKEVHHTAKDAPWEIKTYVAFSDEQQAFEFERHLKTAFGRAFAKKPCSPPSRRYACPYRQQIVKSAHLWFAGSANEPAGHAGSRANAEGICASAHRFAKRRGKDD